MKLDKYAKAIAGAVLAGLTAFYTANQDSHVTVNEWVTVAVAFLTALAVVWGVPNRTEPETIELDDELPALDEPAGDDTVHVEPQP